MVLLEIFRPLHTAIQELAKHGACELVDEGQIYTIWSKNISDDGRLELTPHQLNEHFHWFHFQSNRV